MNNDAPKSGSSPSSHRSGVPPCPVDQDSLLRRMLKKMFPALDALSRFSLPDNSPFQDAIRKLFPRASAQAEGSAAEVCSSDALSALRYGAFGKVFFSASGCLSRVEFFRAAGITLTALQATAFVGAVVLALPLWFISSTMGSLAAFVYSSIPVSFYLFLYGRPILCILAKRLHDAGIRFRGQNALLCLALCALPAGAFFLQPWLLLAAHPVLALLVLPWPSRER